MLGYIKFYLKMFGINFFYFFFAFWLVLAISAIEDNSLVVMRTIFYVCDLIMYLIMLFLIFGKEGENAIKRRHSNDVVRGRIVETGDNLPLEPAEYKTHVGFISGLINSIPLIVLWLIYLITFLSSNGTDLYMGHILNLVYGIFSQPYMNVLGETASVYFGAIYGVVLIVGASGAGYIVGGMKKQREYDVATHREDAIYGE